MIAPTPLQGADLRTLWQIVHRGAIDYGNPVQVALENKLNAQPAGSKFNDYASAYGPSGPYFDNWLMNFAACSDATLDSYASKWADPNTLLAKWGRTADSDSRMQSWPLCFRFIGK